MCVYNNHLNILFELVADRVENIVIDAVSSYSVQMHWTYECSNRVTFQGYRILYCPVQEASVDVPCVGKKNLCFIFCNNKYIIMFIILM